MNKDNINKIIAVLEKDREAEVSHFCMASFGEIIDNEKREAAGLAYGAYHECNTAMCIAGWANFLRWREEAPDRLKSTNFLNDLDDKESAAEWLDIEENLANALFLMWNSPIDLEDFDHGLTKQQRYAAGIAVLEILRDAGIVDWTAALAKAGVRIEQVEDPDAE